MIKSSESISLQNVCKVYQTPAGRVAALNHVNLSVLRGEFIGIVGKSGAGKSTLVNMITGVDSITSGSVIVGNTSVHALNEDKRNQWRGKHVGMIYQSFELLHQLTVLENIVLPMDFTRQFHPIKSKERALGLLEQVELLEHADKLPTELSGGQQQRVAIARALVNQPELIVADEPTGNLDSKTGKIILDIFAKLSQQGTTIIMVTHNTHEIAYFSTVYDLTDGGLALMSNRRRKAR